MHYSVYTMQACNLLFTQKTNSEPYQNVHGSVCLHRSRIRNRTKIGMVHLFTQRRIRRNRTKIGMVLPVYTEEEFRTVLQFAYI